MEIERQFLVSALPDLPAEFDTLEQGYITLVPEIRFRSVNHERFYLTVKRGAGLSREEWETEITAVEYANLKERLFPGTCVIRKRRYHLPLSDGHIAELFVHGGHLSGLNYVKVEFAAESEARAFTPPLFFGREVTDDARFSYGALAREDGMKVVHEILAGGA